MIVRRLISIFLIAIYAIIVGHDLMSHHHQTSVCQEHTYQSPNLNHNDCDHSNTCEFPFHQHNMDEAGVFLNASTLELNFDYQNLSPTDLFDYLDAVHYTSEIILVDFTPTIYKGPDLSSAKLRGPPLA